MKARVRIPAGSKKLPVPEEPPKKAPPAKKPGGKRVRIEKTAPTPFEVVLTSEFASFGTMLEIAVEELRRHWAEKKDEPRGAWAIACPSPSTRTSPVLMRSSVRELLGRVAAGSRVDSDAVRRLTRAELIGLFSAASLRHPLPHYEVVAFELLFAEVFAEMGVAPPFEIRSVFPEEEKEARALIAERLAGFEPLRVKTIRELRDFEPPTASP